MTLKRPAPLDVELRTEIQGDRATLFHGLDVLATADPARLEIAVPEPPPMAAAAAAEAGFRPDLHLYPGCFVCGPEREAGDGWRIFPGPIAEGRVAASWTAAAEFADADGIVRSEFVWAALDCPGYFAVQEPAGLALLGRMAVVIHEPVPAGEPLVIQAWKLGSDGRKHDAGTAIHSANGRLLAAARQTWVSLKAS